MSQPCKKIPMIVNRAGKKRVVEIRRESDVELMQDSLNRNGFIRLRVFVQIKGKGASYYGYHGVSACREVKSIQEARSFVSALQTFVEGV